MKEEKLTELVLRLKDKGLTLAFAESATAGLLPSEMTKATGVTDVLLGSVVSYSPEAKQKILGVKKETLDLYTAESQQVTNEMMMGLHKLLKADISIAVTGLCGPGGSETPDKPVGTTFVSAMCGGKVEEFREVFKGDFAKIREQTINFVFEKVEQLVERHIPN